MSAALLALLAAAASAAIEVRPHPGADLMGLVELLASERPAPTTLAARAVARFERWRGHAAVSTFKALRASGFRGIVPSQYALYLSEPPGLKPLWPVPEHFERLAGGRERLERFRRELSSLAVESGWMSWREEHRAPLEAPAVLLRGLLDRRDLEKPAADFLGLALWRRWTAVVSPFYPEGSHSAWIIEETGERPELVTVVGLGTAAPGEESAARWLWPEALYTAAYALWELCHPGPEALSSRVCRGVEGPRVPENCVETVWVAEMLDALLRREFGAEPGRPPRRRARRAVARYEKERERFPDILAAADLLWEPFLKKPAACRLIEPARYQEEVYARRLYAASLAVLERRPGDAVWAEAARRLEPNAGPQR